MKANLHVRTARRVWGAALTTVLVCSLVPASAFAEVAEELAATEEAVVPEVDDIIAENRATNEVEPADVEVTEEIDSGGEAGGEGNTTIIEDGVAENWDTNEGESAEAADENAEAEAHDEDAGPSRENPSPTVSDEETEPACAAAELEAGEATEAEVQNLTKATVAQIARQTYTGSAIRPKVMMTLDGKALVEGVDYTVAYASNVNVGTAKVTVTGKGTCTCSATATFQIVPAQMAKATIAKIANQGYTGKAKRPKPTVTYGGRTLVAGRDYTVSYKNNKKKGTAKVTVTGKGNFAGTKVAKFKIVGRKSVKTKKVKVKVATGYYAEGRAVKPAVKVTYKGKKLVEGVDYTLSYKSNKKVGTAKVTVRGKGAWKGSKTKSFKILKRRSLESDRTEVKFNKSTTGVVVRYDGLRLHEGVDYTVGYRTVGSYTVATVRGTGIYVGRVQVGVLAETNPERRSCDLADAKISFKAFLRVESKGGAETYVLPYKGKAPSADIVTVEIGGVDLCLGTDYEVAFSNAVGPSRDVSFSVSTPGAGTQRFGVGGRGLASVTVTGKGRYHGSKTLCFHIDPARLRAAFHDVSDEHPAVGDYSDWRSLNNGETVESPTAHITYFDQDLLGWEMTETGYSTAVDSMEFVLVPVVRDRYMEWLHGWCEENLAGLSDLEKVTRVQEYICNCGQYDTGYTSARTLHKYGKGTCRSGAQMLRDMCVDQGIQAVVRFAGKDAEKYGLCYGQLDGHYNCFVWIDGTKYIAGATPSRSCELFPCDWPE